MLSRQSLLRATRALSNRSVLPAGSTLVACVPSVASLHTSPRTTLGATGAVGIRATRPAYAEVDGTTAEADTKVEEPHNIHLHPRIWLDTELTSVVTLLLSQATDKDAVPQEIKDRWAGETLETKNAILAFYDHSCQTYKDHYQPVLEKLAKEDALDTSLITLDVDKVPKLAQTFGITRLPTLVGMYEGKPIRQIQGVPEDPEPLMRKFIDDLGSLSQYDDVAAAAQEAGVAPEGQEPPKDK